MCQEKPWENMRLFIRWTVKNGGHSEGDGTVHEAQKHSS